MTRRRNIIWAALVAIVLAVAAPVDAGPWEDAAAAFERGDYTTAHQLWRSLAEQGDRIAQYNLGINYRDGHGIPQDYAVAIKWFRLSAEQNYSSAQRELGTMYLNGRGIPQDYVEAVKWYRLSVYAAVTN